MLKHWAIFENPFGIGFESGFRMEYTGRFSLSSAVERVGERRLFNSGDGAVLEGGEIGGNGRVR